MNLKRNKERSTKKKYNKENTFKNFNVDTKSNNQLSTITTECFDTKESYSKLQNDLKNYKKALTESQAINNANVKEMSKLQHELWTLQTKYQRMNDTFNRAVQEKEELEKIIKELNYENAAILKENEILKSKLKNIGEDIKTYQVNYCNQISKLETSKQVLYFLNRIESKGKGGEI